MSTPVLDTMPVIPARRSRSPAIIDVDLMDDEEIAASQRPFQRRRIESNDDIIEVPNPHPHAGGSSSRYRSPPPPRRGSVAPPVPPVPTHLRGSTSLARRRGPSGIVRGSSQPFGFEANFANAQRASNPPETELTAAAPSHHVPAMGIGRLGGAIIAQNSRSNPNGGSARRNVLIPRPRIRHIPAISQATNFLATNLRLLLDQLHRSEDHWVMGMEEQADFDALEDMSFYTNLQSLTDSTMSDHAGPALRKMEYKPAFTHPGKMPADFTHDFGSSTPNDSIVDVNAAGPSSAARSGSGSSPVDTILVCAKCLDPLVIGGLGEAADSINRRLWALRCGHILDGKCIGDLMKPEGELEPAPPPPDPAVEEAPVAVSPKGKGKTRHVDPGETPLPTQAEPRIRRLRSGRAVPLTDDSTFDNRPTRQRKGKAKVRVPRVEREHDWRCPVSGCGKVHQSVFVDGHWKMDERTGAIMMFV